MADYVEERRPAEHVIVHEHDEDMEPRRRGDNPALIIGLVILAVIILLMLFGRNLFGGGGTNINVQPTEQPTTPVTGGQE